MHGADMGFTVDIGEQAGRAGQDVSIAKRFDLGISSGVTPDHVKQALHLMSIAVDQAAHRLFVSDEAEAFPPGLHLGGSTLSLAVVCQCGGSQHVFLANVGDSRVVVTPITDGKQIIAQTMPDVISPEQLPSEVLTLIIEGEQPKAYCPQALGDVAEEDHYSSQVHYHFTTIDNRNRFLRAIQTAITAKDLEGESILRVPIDDHSGINISGAKGHGHWALKRQLSIVSLSFSSAICIQATTDGVHDLPGAEDRLILNAGQQGRAQGLVEGLCRRSKDVVVEDMDDATLVQLNVTSITGGEVAIIGVADGHGVGGEGYAWICQHACEILFPQLLDKVVASDTNSSSTVKNWLDSICPQQPIVDDPSESAVLQARKLWDDLTKDKDFKDMCGGKSSRFRQLFVALTNWLNNISNKHKLSRARVELEWAFWFWNTTEVVANYNDPEPMK